METTLIRRPVYTKALSRTWRYTHGKENMVARKKRSMGWRRWRRGAYMKTWLGHSWIPLRSFEAAMAPVVNLKTILDRLQAQHKSQEIRLQDTYSNPATGRMPQHWYLMAFRCSSSHASYHLSQTMPLTRYCLRWLRIYLGYSDLGLNRITFAALYWLTYVYIFVVIK